MIYKLLSLKTLEEDNSQNLLSSYNDVKNYIGYLN